VLGAFGCGNRACSGVLFSFSAFQSAKRDSVFVTTGSKQIRIEQKHRARLAGRTAVVLLLLTALTACTTARLNGNPDQEAAAPPPPPAPPLPPAPPPVDVAGKWKFSATSGACVMTLTANPGAADGTVAPAGGCPGAFYTSRKWSYEHDRLILRDHKGNVLIELSFAGGHFQGQGPNGAVTLAR